MHENLFCGSLWYFLVVGGGGMALYTEVLTIRRPISQLFKLASALMIDERLLKLAEISKRSFVLMKHSSH